MDIGIILTLRYDPSPDAAAKDPNFAIRNILPEQLIYLRQQGCIPSSQDLENELRRCIRNKLQKNKSDRITVALSSGVDSCLVLSLIRSEFPDINIECLNITFDEDSSEAKDAEEIAKCQDAGFHEIHIANPLKELPLLLSIIKEPRWNVYQYYFIENARRYSDILFTGDGGDELFAGYTFRYKKFVQELSTMNRFSSWEDRARSYLSCHERDWVPDQEEMFIGTEVKFSWLSIYQRLKKYFDNNLDPLEQLLLADYHGKLMYDFIPTNEKFFKYFDMVGSAPLLDASIIDLSMKIPVYLKYDLEKNIGKIQLREIIGRNRAIQSSIDMRERKIGFGMDLHKLWSRYGREMVTSYLDKGRILEDKIINKEWYHRSIDRITRDKQESPNTTRYISKMLQLLALEVWYRLFRTAEINSRSSL